MSLPKITALALALAALAQPAAAETAHKTGRFGGYDVSYVVVTPPGYDPARAYPAVLVFTGGGQQMRGVEGTVTTDWKDEAERRGYIIVSPAAPAAGALYFADGEAIFPEFLDTIRRDYRIVGKLHVAGHSNGGLSAFHVASRHPQYFATLTGYPGLMYGSLAPMARLKSMCVFMHVGGQDPDWAQPMKAQFDTMTRQGFRVRYRVEPGQGHRLQAPRIGLSKRLFDQIESCR